MSRFSLENRLLSTHLANSCLERNVVVHVVEARGRLGRRLARYGRRCARCRGRCAGGIAATRTAAIASTAAGALRVTAATAAALLRIAAIVLAARGAALALAAAEHLHLVGADFGGVFFDAVLVGPLARAQAAFDVDLRALAQVLAGDFGQAAVEDDA